MTAYAELQLTTNYSFLRGASHPEEMMLAAATLGYEAVAVTDRNTLAGVVRAHVAAKEYGIRLVVGTRLDFEDAPGVLCFPSDRAAYGRLCRLLSTGKRRAEKGSCRLYLADLLEHDKGQIILALAPKNIDGAFENHLRALKEAFADRLYLAVSHLYRGDDKARITRLAGLARRLRIPLAATNDAHAHTPKRRPLQDVLSCIREHCAIHDAGYRLFANAERHLKPPHEMARLFKDYPDAVARTAEIAGRCAFSLDELKYEYPVDPVPDGSTPQRELERLSWEGAKQRYPGGVGDKVIGQINYELKLIGELGYAPYFLTVHDIVRFAKSKGILCQGRGSAANSAVCFVLGITEVDPARIDVVFERFVSAARNEPPDIDVDFEHERREEVIQYIYRKYSRDHAGLTAAVITYRNKSAIREVAKVFNLSDDSITALQRIAWRRPISDVTAGDIREAGLDPNDATVRRVLALAAELRGFPRHLTQHSGGFVMTASPLNEVVPIENTAMEERTMIEWDKDDLDALGILKIDVLALGMLTCVRKCFELLEDHYARPLSMATVPAEDARVYDMLCKGDSVGVFQVESRAQMSMLPRLKPRTFYDLVIEVAIVRPGPIQGGMVHPYLRRRQGKEAVDYPSEELRAVLGKTLGVPLFQEQAMQIAIVAAGFTPTEADHLRRAMAAFRRTGRIQHFRDKLIDGMVANGYTADFAERCFQQIEGFSEYGFPESHAASFALLVYVSSWLKRHYPEVFTCGLLNSQPMGFYAPAQLVRDAREHGVEVRPVDVNHSHWDCTLEPAENGTHRRALRLGFRQVKGLPEEGMRDFCDARGIGFVDIDDMLKRARPKPSVLETLAKADAFGSLGLPRREALWALRNLTGELLPLFDTLPERDSRREPGVVLPAMPLGEEVAEDFRAIQLSLKAHPLQMLRESLDKEGVTPNAQLAGIGDSGQVTVSGLVINRQRPGSASGVIFATLEDETGVANLVIWPKVFDRFRNATLLSRLMTVKGEVQKDPDSGVIHLIAESIRDDTPRLNDLLAGKIPSLEKEGYRNLKWPIRDFH